MKGTWFDLGQRSNKPATHDWLGSARKLDQPASISRNVTNS